MEYNAFSYKELLTYGWEKTKHNFWFLFWVGLVYILINFFTAYIPVIGNIIAMLTNIAIVALMLLIVSGVTPKFNDILKPFQTYKITWHYFLAMVATFLVVALGFIALIIPGIYLATRFQFFPYLIVENENLGPLDAMKKSWKLTEGKFWKLFGWMVVMAVVNFVGFLALGVGLLFTIPTTWIAHAHLYKRLHPHTSAAS